MFVPLLTFRVLNTIFSRVGIKAIQLESSSDHFSLFISWEVFSPLKSKMQVLVLLLSTSLVYGAVSPAKREADPAHHGYSSGPRCHDKKDHQCHKIPKHQEHDECEHIVDTTYIEECEYVTHTHCEEEHTEVHHESHVVGHDSHVEHHGSYGHGGYHKREADAEAAHDGYSQGYSHGPKCHDKKDKQCHKIPKSQKHKECKKIVDTTYIEECEEVVHTHCEEEHKEVHHSSHVVGHDSHVEHYGHSGHGGHY